LAILTRFSAEKILAILTDFRRKKILAIFMKLRVNNTNIFATISPIFLKIIALTPGSAEAMWKAQK
jgi:hypothetical protein